MVVDFIETQKHGKLILGKVKMFLFEIVLLTCINVLDIDMLHQYPHKCAHFFHSRKLLKLI